MASIVSTTYINESPELVFKIISQLDAFAKNIAGVRRIASKYNVNNKKITEWEIDIDGTTVRWTEEQYINRSALSLYFHMIDGDFANYIGQWTVKPMGTGTRLEFMFNVEWELQIDHPSIADELDRKAKLASRWVLREIRKKIGVGKTISVVTHGTIISQPFQTVNARKMKIIGLYDHLDRNSADEPFVVVVPGYGETKRDSLTVSYYLAKNGYNVIRYDATDHIGESDGDIRNTTLNKSKDDLISVIDYITRTYGVKGVSVVAGSLAQRVAMKAASEDSRISLLIGLVGVVNLEETIKEIYREDAFKDISQGKIKESYEILGYVIDKQFPLQAIASNYHDLDSTIRDVKKIRIPIILFFAEKDAWTSLKDANLVMTHSMHPLSKIEVIPDAMHQLNENPQVMRTTLKQIVVTSNSYLRNAFSSTDDIVEPTKRELAVQNKVEKDRLKLVSKYTKQDEKKFWDSYMNKFILMSKSPDYNEYFSRVSRVLNINGGRLKLLDAGCGNGYLGTSLLLKALNSKSEAKDIEGAMSGDRVRTEYEYYGLDRSEKILDIAKKGHEGILYKKTSNEPSSSSIVATCRYKVADLNRSIPYSDKSFDRVCASLLLSYLENPVEAVAELVRVLKPSGIIMLSSLKPGADMSQVYRNFLDVCEDESDIVLARELLNEAGQIRDKVSKGYYYFYNEKELKTLLAASGIRNISCVGSFGNQAVIAVGKKAS